MRTTSTSICTCVKEISIWTFGTLFHTCSWANFTYFSDSIVNCKSSTILAIIYIHIYWVKGLISFTYGLRWRLAYFINTVVKLIWIITNAGIYWCIITGSRTTSSIFWRNFNTLSHTTFIISIYTISTIVSCVWVCSRCITTIAYEITLFASIIIKILSICTSWTTSISSKCITVWHTFCAIFWNSISSSFTSQATIRTVFTRYR